MYTVLVKSLAILCISHLNRYGLFYGLYNICYVCLIITTQMDWNKTVVFCQQPCVLVFFNFHACYVFKCISGGLFMYVSIYLFTYYLCTHSLTHSMTYLPTYPPTHPPMYIPGYPPTHVYTYIPTYLPVLSLP